jgi:transposase
MSKRKKPTYSSEFKSEAISLALKQNYTIAKAAANLGISESALRKWINKAQTLGLEPKVSDAKEKEIRELKRELEQTKQERDILKKAILGSSGECNESIQFFYRRIKL